MKELLKEILNILNKAKYENVSVAEMVQTVRTLDKLGKKIVELEKKELEDAKSE